MTDEKIARINEMAKKSREEGLSAEEQQEQAALRREYVEAMKASLRAQLDNTVIVTPEGSRPLRPKKK